MHLEGDVLVFAGAGSGCDTDSATGSSAGWIVAAAS